MKKALIICAAGFSSSIMAVKATAWINEHKKEEDEEYMMEAVSVTEGHAMIRDSDFELFLVSPQTKMFLSKLEESGEKVGKKVIAIPPQAYVPIPTGIQALAQLVLKEMPK